MALWPQEMARKPYARYLQERLDFLKLEDRGLKPVRS